MCVLYYTHARLALCTIQGRILFGVSVLIKEIRYLYISVVITINDERVITINDERVITINDERVITINDERVRLFG